MPNHPGTTQRLLDLYLSLPVGAPDHVLEAALIAHSPGLNPVVLGVRMSEARVLTDPAVRRALATIAAWAARAVKSNRKLRYGHKFLATARAIRDGRPLP